MAKQCEVARRTGWCGYCYEGLRGRRVYRGHAGVQPRVERKKGSWTMLKRRVRPEGSGGSSKPLEECSFSKRYPTVAEFLSKSEWEDGQPRVTGTITLIFDQGTVKAAVNDRDAGFSSFLSARTLTSLWEALEKGLIADSLEWREKPPEGRRGPRK